MKTKAEILNQLGYTVNGGDLQKTHLFNLVISQAMDEYAHQLQRRIEDSIKQKIFAATWAAFVEFEPYIESENAIEELRAKHEKFCAVRGYSSNSKKNSV